MKKKKADFTHQSITMATHLNPSPLVLADALGGRGHVKDLSGWEGDTTKNANDMAPSIGNDDYKADLDAVNMANRITSRELSYTQAMNEYMSDINSKLVTREAEFKEHVSLDTVKSTIFDSLVPDSASGKILSSSDMSIIYEEPTEEQSMDYLKKHYPDSYTFIKSLEEEANLFSGGQ